jgi:hypothetical protein
MVGLECLAVTARLRRTPALAIPLGAAGITLMLLGAGNAGQGWLALALLGAGVTLTLLAADTHGSARPALQIGGALAVLWSWGVAAAWLGWTVQQTIDVTTLAAGLLAVAASLAARRDRIGRSWLLVWGGMAVAVAGLAAGYTETIAGVAMTTDAAASWPVAAGLLLTAAALLSGSGPLALTWLRGLGIAFGVVSLVASLQAGHAGSGTQVAVLAGLSSLFAVLSLSLFIRGQASTWQRPPLALGVAFALGALAVALPSVSAQDLILLVPGLAASALQAAAVGIVLRDTVVQMLSPVLACASWLVFSSEAMGDNPQWITMPMGVAILAVVELWRRDRKQHGGLVAATEIVVLELTGVAFLVGAAFVQTLTEAVVYAVPAAVLGLALMLWGVLTKVRRRPATGAAIVLASLVLLVAVPLVGLLPAWQGAALWVLIAGVGLVALLVASFLEQGKAAVHKGLKQFSEATVGWE